MHSQEDIPLKDIMNKKPMKCLNKIMKKRDKIFKEINKENHPMTKDFKSIEEINRMIKYNGKVLFENKEDTYTDQENKILITNDEETKDVEEIVPPFEIDLKIFESSEESVIFIEEKRSKNKRNKHKN